eukprot:GSChrysophyteH1.ASY1.ANO1.246.1 assembled CDS
MRKKYAVLQRELEDMKEETRQLLDKEKELYDSIKMLEKEVSAHKKEIKAKDISTGEKEKRIYELKKKNQELDKFKFVLDFKIRELKQQIEPRQLEILRMRDKIKKMDEELERHHKSNTNLDDLIGALQMTIAHILDPPKLKKHVEILAKEHGAGGPIKPRIDPDVENEYSRHREFLQRSVLQLKKYLAEGSHEHMLTNSQLMGNNLDTIDNINKQREDIKSKKKNKTQIKDVSLPGGASNTSSTKDGDIDPTTILERNRQRILALRAAIQELESRRTSVKATSILPPLGPDQTTEPRIAFYTQAQNADQLASPRPEVGDKPAEVAPAANAAAVAEQNAAVEPSS